MTRVEYNQAKGLVKANEKNKLERYLQKHPDLAIRPEVLPAVANFVEPGSVFSQLDGVLLARLDNQPNSISVTDLRLINLQSKDTGSKPVHLQQVQKSLELKIQLAKEPLAQSASQVAAPSSIQLSADQLKQAEKVMAANVLGNLGQLSVGQSFTLPTEGMKTFSDAILSDDAYTTALAKRIQTEAKAQGKDLTLEAIQTNLRQTAGAFAEGAGQVIASLDGQASSISSMDLMVATTSDGNVSSPEAEVLSEKEIGQFKEMANVRQFVQQTENSPLITKPQEQLQQGKLWEMIKNTKDPKQAIDPGFSTILDTMPQEVVEKNLQELAAHYNDLLPHQKEIAGDVFAQLGFYGLNMKTLAQERNGLKGWLTAHSKEPLAIKIMEKLDKAWQPYANDSTFGKEANEILTFVAAMGPRQTTQPSEPSKPEEPTKIEMSGDLKQPATLYTPPAEVGKKAAETFAAAADKNALTVKYGSATDLLRPKNASMGYIQYFDSDQNGLLTSSELKKAFGLDDKQAENAIRFFDAVDGQVNSKANQPGISLGDAMVMLNMFDRGGDAKGPVHDLKITPDERKGMLKFLDNPPQLPDPNKTIERLKNVYSGFYGPDVP